LRISSVHVNHHHLHPHPFHNVAATIGGGGGGASVAAAASAELQETFVRIFEDCKKLKELTVRLGGSLGLHSGSGSGGVGLLNVGRISKDLTYVDVSGCWFLGEDFGTTLGLCCPGLKVAVLKGTGIGDVGLRGVVEGCKYLVKLDVGRCQGVSVQFLWDLVDLAGSGRGGVRWLEELGCGYCMGIWRSREVVKAFMGVLKICRRLRRWEVAPAAFPVAENKGGGGGGGVMEVSEESKSLMDLNLCFAMRQVNEEEEDQIMATKRMRGGEGVYDSKKASKRWLLTRTEIGMLQRRDLIRMARVRFEGRLEVDLNLRMLRRVLGYLEGGIVLEKEEEELMKGSFEFQAFTKAFVG
jgi:hypothetical protein